MTNGRTLVSMNFEMKEPDAAAVSVFDRGFLYGDSVYEVVRTYGQVPFAFHRHFRRLARSAGALGFSLPFEEERLKRHFLELAGRWGSEDCYLRVIVTRGTCEVRLLPPEHPDPLTVVIAGPPRSMVPTARCLLVSITVIRSASRSAT